MRFILLTGLSGAGKTTSLRYLEDMGCPYVDNLPPAMILRFMELWTQSSPGTRTIVMAVDIRSGDLFDAHALWNLVSATRSTGTDVRVLFLEADDETLLNRFKETRREHPLYAAEGDLMRSIARERERLQPLRETADMILDTSGLSPRMLREQLQAALFDGDAGSQRIGVELVSFGFKRGLVRDADLIWDVRFLPNPFYEEDLKRLTGNDQPVADFICRFPQTFQFLKKEEEMLEFLLPQYISEGKSQLVISVGCTGGQHRSVFIANRLYEFLRTQGYAVQLTHRDLQRKNK